MVQRNLLEGFKFSDHVIYAAVFLVLFLIGILGGRSIGMALRSKGTNQVEILTEPTPKKGSGQWNLVVISVDQFSSTRVSLIGIWLIVTSTGSDTLTLVPIFPSGNIFPGPNEVTWAEMFYLDTDLRPSREFLSALSKHLLWDEYLLIDQKGITTIIDDFTKFESAEQANEFPGSEITSSGSKLELNLDGQLKIWQIVCNQLAAKNNPNELDKWLDEIKPYTHSWFEFDEIFHQLNLQGNTQIKLKCEFPTLTLNSP